MDWSADGQYLRSTDNAATLLYWYGPELKPFTDHTGFFRDTRWGTESVVLGWDRKHIFGQGFSINDCNSVTVSPNKVALVAGYDTGDLRLYPYPAISDQMPCKIFYGHCSHVMGVKFTQDNRYLISVGGQDLCVFQWRHIQARDNHALQQASHLGGIAMRAN
uniref:EML-like second beta-propeller domain-containing protein n=1 Tax=Hemiselmis tepida TaxID=464990 RepID=A0A7S0VWM3_9CRYP|mmetsp:Transcript_27159/g.68923  ORF Transcript_27159/g.68923 Transcript_27159/m.68923 type:complete len:162 (+) Transcript_27159:142-627(+)